MAQWKSSLMDLKDYGEPTAEGQMKSKAIFNLIAGEDFPNVTGTRENLEISKVQFEELTENIITILEKY